ncbi:MAG: DUF4097 and DUF4098 domain-containing protein YvlB [Colwellia sp.]|jgi:DUF4097 and DUF4098 domain-containing protein YvlB
MVTFGAALTNIELVNGSLVIEQVKGEIKANTVNGSINVQNSADNFELNSVNGSIKLYMPSDLSALINAETMHGSIHIEFGLSSDKKMFSGRRLSGTVGSGDIHINLESVNSRITLMKN